MHIPFIIIRHVYYYAIIIRITPVKYSIYRIIDYSRQKIIPTNLSIKYSTEKEYIYI